MFHFSFIRHPLPVPLPKDVGSSVVWLHFEWRRLLKFVGLVATAPLWKQNGLRTIRTEGSCQWEDKQNRQPVENTAKNEEKTNMERWEKSKMNNWLECQGAWLWLDVWIPLQTERHTHTLINTRWREYECSWWCCLLLQSFWELCGLCVQYRYVLSTECWKKGGQ